MMMQHYVTAPNEKQEVQCAKVGQQTNKQNLTRIESNLNFKFKYYSLTVVFWHPDRRPVDDNSTALYDHSTTFYDRRHYGL